VLVESIRQGKLYGHTPDYYEAEFTGQAHIGQTVWVRVHGIDCYTLQGQLESIKAEPARLLAVL
jgi:threonylcarbamoyladenosine tRNA methylthiotransferase MtaB